MRGINKEIKKHSIEAFWAKVEVGYPRDCWPWTGAKTPNGYGNVRLNSTYHKAHRLAWHLANFKIPDGFLVCHACDNPSCCNPGHLLLGTSRSNFTDMIKKNRGQFKKNKAIGERNFNAKLSDEKVIDIRRKYNSGVADQYQLAAEYGVSQVAIGCVVRLETWRHVQCPKI